MTLKFRFILPELNTAEDIKGNLVVSLGNVSSAEHEDAIKEKGYQNQKKENKNSNRNESGSSKNDGDSKENTNTD